MSLREIKKNLKQTIKKGGNPKIVEVLEKKLESLKDGKVNKKL